MRPLHREPGATDVGVADGPVDASAIHLLVYQQRLHERLHRRPDRRDGLSRHVVELVHLSAQLLLDGSHPGPEHLSRGAVPIGRLDAVERRDERGVGVSEDRQARLDVVLARPASGRDELRCEAREVDLSERRRPRDATIGKS